MSFATAGFAQTPVVKKPNRGLVVAEEGGTVFSEPNFEAQVIATVSPGEVYDISSGKKEMFYKIRVKPGMVGWISDADIRPVNEQQAQMIAQKKKQMKAAANRPAKAEKKEKSRRNRPFHMKRFRGLVIEMVNYAEDTMGSVRKEALTFFGMKFTGPDTLFEGEMDTETEILYAPGAPKYYKEATGNGADGFIFVGNFLFTTAIPQGRGVSAFYGFGPSFRFSHYNLTLGTRSYAADDMTLGAVFNLGVAMGFDRYSVRLDGRYYWETQRYTSLGASFLMDF